MLQYYMTIISYTQQLLDMDDLFGTSTNCTEVYKLLLLKVDTSGSWIRAFECGLRCKL